MTTRRLSSFNFRPLELNCANFETFANCLASQAPSAPPLFAKEPTRPKDADHAEPTTATERLMMEMTKEAKRLFQRLIAAPRLPVEREPATTAAAAAA